MHKTFCVGAIDQGLVFFQIKEKLVKLQPGSLALINPETLHSCIPTESDKRSYYMLFLDVEWCLQLQQSLWQRDDFSPVKTTMLEDLSIYQQYIDAVKSLMDEGDLLEKEQNLVELAGSIFLRVCEPTAERSGSCVQMEQLKQQLGTNLDTDITMSQIAQKLQANPYTLPRQCKTATGITPHAYRLNCRIELAKKLMQKGVDLSQVALDCGFFDQSHFHRHFKAMTTVTPREYQVSFVQ